MDHPLLERVCKFAQGYWLGLALICLATLQTHAEGIPLQLNGLSSSAELNLSVPADRKTTLFLLPTATITTPLPITIVAVNFSNANGSLGVTLQNPADQGTPDAKLNLTLDANTPLIIPLVLMVDDFLQGDQYAGNLIVTSKGSSPLIWKINLGKKPSTGTLVLDRQAVTLAITKPFLISMGTPASFTVNVREKSGRVGLDGVNARLEQLVKSPPTGFDLNQNVAFSFNDQQVPDFTRWPPATPNGPDRSISPSGQATVRMALNDLHAGEYNAVIRFQSANPIADDAQKLTLNVQVRDHWLWALLVLIFAVALSFAATKVMSSRRQRMLFMRRIEELKPAWLNDEPKLLPVVWAQAILRQSQDLSKRFWLTGEDQIEARVSQVEGMMKVLDRIRVLRNDIQNSTLRKYVKYRAIAKLNGIVSSMGSGFVDDAMVKDLDDSLTNLRQWLDESSGLKYYWRDFRMDIALLLADVQPSFFPELYSPLVQAAKLDVPSNENDVIAIEEQYAKMKILWERRDAPAPEIDRLKAEAVAKAKEEVFRQADQEAWDRLNKDTLKIKVPDVDDINVLMAYTPAQFSVEPSDASLAGTYLFQHSLNFQWTFSVTLGKPKKQQAGQSAKPEKRRTMKLTPATEQPQVIQYFPQAGEVKVSVEISWRGAPGQSIKLDGPGPLPIADCNDFKVFRGLEKVEIISFMAAAVAAIVTGITTFYLKNSGFGATSDYLTLFAWGFGIDQSKNFLQNLQGNSK